MIILLKLCRNTECFNVKSVNNKYSRLIYFSLPLIFFSTGSWTCSQGCAYLFRIQVLVYDAFNDSRSIVFQESSACSAKSREKLINRL